jgi:hypothetical protein
MLDYTARAAAAELPDGHQRIVPEPVDLVALDYVS